MKQTERRYEVGVSVAVMAVFAALWAIEFGLGAPPEVGYVASAVLVAMIAMPWVIAARLLWRAWWARSGAGRSTMDWPGWLLAAAIATLPDDRRDWGQAMTAELAQVQGRASRWWFAAGCARTAMFPPHSSRVPVGVVGALTAAAVVAAGLAVGHALPALRVFAVSFVALVGAMATLGVARSNRVGQAAPGVTITTAGVAGVAACIAVVAYLLVKHPTAGADLQPKGAVAFAAVLAGCLWLALSPPRGLTTHRLARRLGVGTALTLGVGLVLASRLALSEDLYVQGWLDPESGVSPYVIFAPVVIFFAASAVAAAVARSLRAGVQAAVWAALLGTLAVFVIGLLEAQHWYRTDARLLFDGEPGYPIGNNLADFIWVLVGIPFLGLPFGVIGAALGAKRRRRRSREFHDPGPQPDGHTTLL